MKRYSAYIIFLLLILPIVAWSGWHDMEGKPIPDTHDMKSAGEFGAKLILTDKEEEIFRRWDIPSQVVRVDTTNKIKRGEILSALIVFSGCKPDQKGNCRVIANYQVLQPNESIYAELPQTEVWIDKPVPPNKTLEMSVEYLRIMIEPNEPLGKYIIKVDVIDLNNNSKLKLTSSFIAIEK